MSVRLIASLIGILGIVALAYFAVTSYRSMAEENANLSKEVTTLKAEKKATESALALMAQTIDKNETNTTRVIERTREIERQINNAPKTTDCINSPSITALIAGLRDNEQRAGHDVP